MGLMMIFDSPLPCQVTPISEDPLNDDDLLATCAPYAPVQPVGMHSVCNVRQRDLHSADNHACLPSPTELRMAWAPLDARC